MTNYEEPEPSNVQGPTDPARPSLRQPASPAPSTPPTAPAPTWSTEQPPPAYAATSGTPTSETPPDPNVSPGWAAQTHYSSHGAAADDGTRGGHFTGVGPSAAYGNQQWYPSPTFAPQPPPFGRPDLSHSAYGQQGTTPSPAMPSGTTTVRRPRRRLGLAAAFTAVALLAGGIGGTTGALVSDRDTTTAAAASTTTTSAPVSGGSGTSDGVASVAAKALPSVVEITVKSQAAEGVGSGVVLTSDGLILTNNHVATGAGSGATITVTFAGGKTAQAQVVGTNPSADLAVLKAEGVSGLTPATLGNSAAVQVGDEVVAIGSPAGLDATVTSGIVSYLGRKVSVQAENSDPYGSAAAATVTYDAIQTDAAINPGNSGGPLLNSAGEVIGINSVIYSPAADESSAGSVGLGFAIPSNQAKSIVQKILADAGLSLS